MRNNTVSDHDALVRLHHAALDDLDGYVRAAAAADQTRATPCAGWTIADLLAHEHGQLVGFASAFAPAEAAGAAGFEPRHFDPDAWARVVAHLRRAVDRAAPSSTVLLPELHPALAFPVERAIAFRALDSLVHAWDLARGIGTDYEPTPELVAWAAIESAEVPLDRRGPDFAFQPPARVETGSRWHATLAHLGRDPHWSAA